MSDVPGSIHSVHSNHVPSLSNLQNEDMSLDIPHQLENEHEPSFAPIPAVIAEIPFGSIPTFDKSAIKRQQFVGSGNQGICYKIYLQNIGICAWKEEQVTSRNARYRERERFYAAVLNHHPHILPLYGFMFEGNYDNYKGIVMEYLPGGSLSIWFRDHRSVELNFEHKIKWTMQIALAVSYMHQRGIIHRDICPSNILLTQIELPNSAKLGDLGLAREVNNRMTINLGHTLYMAPEMIENPTEEYDFSADVFSFGMTLYTIFSEKLPFQDEGSERWTFQEKALYIKRRLLGTNTALPTRPTLPEEWGHIRTVIEMCWKTDPQERYTMEQVCASLEEHYGF